MSRPLRIDYPNAWHHVMNRARSGAVLFLDRYEVRPTTLKPVRRGLENEPRDVAIWLIRSMRTEPLMRVGAGIGLNRYSSLSSAVMRVKTKLQESDIILRRPKQSSFAPRLVG
jgi:hypothetical protein